MADVTISQLNQSIPSSNSILPYSTGSNTLGVPVSAIFQNSSSNLGIGTNNPSSALDVNGTIKATGLSVPGTVLNVVQAIYNDESDIATGPAGVGNNWNDVPNLSVNITPKFASSKFLLKGIVHFTFNASTTCSFRFVRNGTAVGLGKSGTGANGTTVPDIASFRSATPNNAWSNPATGEFIDTPNTTSQITYKIQYKPYYSDNRTLRWNNSFGETGDRLRVFSSLIVTEIAG